MAPGLPYFDHLTRARLALSLIAKVAEHQFFCVVELKEPAVSTSACSPALKTMIRVEIRLQITATDLQAAMYGFIAAITMRNATAKSARPGASGVP
jgi:hypothetical protein